MFYYLFQPLIFIYCARLKSLQPNCLDQIWFLTCTLFETWNPEFRQFFIFIVQAILFDPKDFPLCLKLWIASIFFIQFGSFLFLACQIMHGTDLNFIFHLRHLFLFICAKFSLSAIFRHHFFIVIFSFCAANVYVTLQLMIMVHMLLLYHGS